MWPNPYFLRIWSHLVKKSFMKNFIFCAVWFTYDYKSYNYRDLFNELVFNFLCANFHVPKSRHRCEIYTLSLLEPEVQLNPNVPIF